MVCKTDHILLPTVFFLFFLTLESSASCLHGGHCSFCVRREFFFSLRISHQVGMVP